MVAQKTYPRGKNRHRILNQLSLTRTKFGVIMVSVIMLGFVCGAHQETRELLLSHFLEPARISLDMVANIDGENY